MSFVMVDYEVNGKLPEWFEMFGLDKEVWEKRVEKIVERFFPELEDQLIHVRFLDFSNSREYCCFHNLYAGFFHHENLGIFINSNQWVSKEKLSRIVAHELRHYVQLVKGELSTEIQDQYAKANGGHSFAFRNAPWEIDAGMFEDQNWVKCCKVLFPEHFMPIESTLEEYLSKKGITK